MLSRAPGEGKELLLLRLEEIVVTAPRSIPADLTLTAAHTQSAQELGGIAGWVVSVMEAIGAPGAGLLAALENLFPPLPSEVILPLAGFTASQGSFLLAGAIIWTTLGSMVGAIALYWIGAALGRRRLRVIVDKMPLWICTTWTAPRTGSTVTARPPCTPGAWCRFSAHSFRPPAGVGRMSFLLFVLLSAAGSLIWNMIFVFAGYYLGQNWQVAQQFAGAFSRIVLGVLAVPLAWWVIKRGRRNRRRA